MKMAGGSQSKSDALLARLRDGSPLSPREQILLTVRLSLPAMLAQLSAILMGYIDASMVGRLGAEDAAAVGLVTTSTWLIYGLCSAAAAGFTVQIAHQIGGGNEPGARSVVRHGLLSVLAFSLLLAALCALASPFLPVWLGGEEAVLPGASRYFFIFALTLPAVQMNTTAGGMIQCGGNMRLPSSINILMCVLNVIFNALLIFPSRTAVFMGVQIWLPGAGMRIAGAALGTLLATAISAGLMLFFLLFRSPALGLRRREPANLFGPELLAALRIGLPIAFEGLVMGGAYVLSTVIIAPLGSVAIAANSFAVTAEGFCYMPGYGIAIAATTLIGQSSGAHREILTQRLSWLITGLGIFVMAVGGVLLYALAPVIIGFMTPDAAIRELGTAALRLEAFAEPMYAAAIVSGGVFRGRGQTLMPSLVTLFSMWAVRLPLMAWLAKIWGLQGVWLGMCLELWVRGGLFLTLLKKVHHIT
ncbi:MAG: MATE family efflux transporter [Fretibacterium sp.]|nr:MATE family efflux transporter [Fretibacterium sp.]